MDSHEPYDGRDEAAFDRSEMADFSGNHHPTDQIIKSLTEGNLNIMHELLQNVKIIKLEIARSKTETNEQMLEEYTNIQSELQREYDSLTLNFKSYDHVGNTEQIEMSRRIDKRTKMFEDTLRELSEKYMRLSTEGGKRKSRKRKVYKRKLSKQKVYKRKLSKRT